MACIDKLQVFWDLGNALVCLACIVQQQRLLDTFKRLQLPSLVISQTYRTRKLNCSQLSLWIRLATRVKTENERSLRERLSDKTCAWTCSASKYACCRITVTFTDEKDSSVRTVQVPLGTSLLEAAHENNIDLEGKEPSIPFLLSAQRLTSISKLLVQVLARALWHAPHVMSLLRIRVFTTSCQSQRMMKMTC